MTDFCHLHIHSHYSTLDGVIKIPDLVNRIVELQHTACAITDHGVLSGVIDFYSECEKKNVHAILGCECYMTEDPDGLENKTRDNYHLVLLARTNKGLENLTYLVSNANLNNFYYKPRIYRPLLEEYSEGLIALSACQAGYPSRMLRYEDTIQKVFCDDMKDYRRIIHWFEKAFKGNYYLEIQDHDFWEQQAFNDFIVPFARKEKIPLVITTDAHYPKKEDHKMHEMLMAMQFKMTLEEYKDSDQMKYGSSNYIKSTEEVLASAQKWQAEDALDNTMLIASQCETKLTFGEYKLPIFDIKKTKDYKEFKQWQKSNGYQ